MRPPISRLIALCALLASAVGAQPARPERAALPPNALSLADLAAFRPTSANWRVVGDVSADRARRRVLATEPGTGILVNQPTDAAKGHLLTTMEHGDLDLALDVMMPKGSNSGIFLMGRYELQLFDSWGNRAPIFADMGGIMERRDDTRGKGREEFEGTPPSQNASRAPGLWQHVEIAFRAPRFDGTRKIANAKFLRVVVNGVTVQENVEVTGPTSGTAFADERPTGPLMFQGDRGPVALKNLEYKSYTGRASLTGLRYRAWVGDGIDTTWMATRPPTREGASATLSSEPARAPNKFALAYRGTLTVPASGRYRFTSDIDWVGTEASMQGPGVASARLSIDAKPVIANPGASPRAMADVELTAGPHAFEFSVYKNRQWGSERDVRLWIEGPGVERQALHDESALGTFSSPVNPILVAAPAEPLVLRSFEWHRGIKRVYVANVADPVGVHYSYDVAQGAPLYVWRGPFLETTQMWHERGEDQSARPMGSTVELPGTPSIAFLGDANAAWPDSITDERELKRLGYSLDAAGRPTFLLRAHGVDVEDAIRPDSAGVTLTRTLHFRAPASASTAGMYVQLARGSRIARQPDGSYAVGDKQWLVVLPAGAPEPVLRHRPGGDDLLAPVRFDRGEATVAYSIVW
ncbi:MAG TPA: family 16 glycoside hydrolase [Gemmatimonadaceae bacterium]|jgi:hypothetical protein|nr:family 16 glycoside hydrolase [Gemmatimonadaceae bacterium]